MVTLAHLLILPSSRSPALALFLPIRQNKDRWNSQPCARRTRKNCARHPVQERALDEVLWRCRTLYNTALEQRITAYQRLRISVSRFTQEAELQEIRATFPEYAAIHSHVPQDVLARLDKTYQAFFRRIQRGEKAGFPRFTGRSRFHSFTFKEYGDGATLENGFLVRSKIGRISVHWSRPLEGTPKSVTISKEADGWYVSISCAEVPAKPLPATGQETGIDLRIEAFATLSDGARVLTPGCYRKAEALSRQRPAAGVAAQERQPAAPQSDPHPGKSASDRTPPARRLPSQDGAPIGASVRHDLS